MEEKKPASIEYLEDMLAQMKDNVDEISSSVFGLESKIKYAQEELERMKKKDTQE